MAFFLAPNDSCAEGLVQGGIIRHTLDCNCGKLPDWMNVPEGDDVYLGPASTLFLAILAVLLVTAGHRLLPMISVSCCCGALNNQHQQDPQSDWEQTYSYDVRAQNREVHTSWDDDSVHVDNHRVLVDGVETHKRPLPIGAQIYKRHENGDGWYMWSSVVKVRRKKRMTAAAAAARTAAAKESTLRSEITHYQRMTETMKSLIDTALRVALNDMNMPSLGVPHGPIMIHQSFAGDVEDDVELMGTPLDGGRTDSGSSNNDDRLLQLHMHASLDFCEWFNQHRANGTVDRVFAAFRSVDLIRAQQQSDEAEDRNDSTIILVLQLATWIWVLVDYCIFQERPTGNFICTWAYYSSIVMYKPYTIPMWVCLTMCCHYTFADSLLGGSSKGRDPTTGTPHAAPFQRSRLTMSMVVIVAGLQVTWCVWTLPVALPLLLVFLPVVWLVGFALPFGTTFATQKSLSAIQKAVAKKGKTGRSDSRESPDDDLHLLDFEEWIFVLKACATQLVSLAILSFYLL